MEKGGNAVDSAFCKEAPESGTLFDKSKANSRSGLVKRES